jgi:hypothetical protein
LRKLVDAALKRLFAPKKETLGRGEHKYSGLLENSMVTVWVDLGSTFAGQLRYGVSVANDKHSVKPFRLSYESLWCQHGGWDYLTEENAERAIDLLPELVTYLATLVDRVNALADRACLTR